MMRLSADGGRSFLTDDGFEKEGGPSDAAEVLSAVLSGYLKCSPIFQNLGLFWHFAATSCQGGNRGKKVTGWALKNEKK